MGGNSWDDDFYAAKTDARAASGIPAFKYDDDVKKGKVRGVNDKLDPLKMKNGRRECRDSNAHPNSKPIFIGLDVTGSMSSVPVTIQGKLPQLMGLLIRKGYLDHPSICMSAIGDVKYDQYPFQVGQFESGVEIDDDISNVILESGGGGNQQESYEIALYFLARCVDADEFDKRGGKGYAFIICDERLSETVSRVEIEQVFGHKLEKDIKTSDLMKEVLAKWNLFCIVPNLTQYYKYDGMRTEWKKYLGQNVLLLEKPEDISEFIAATVGMNEGNTDVDALVNDLVSVGVDTTSARSMSKSLSVFEKTNTKGTGLTTL